MTKIGSSLIFISIFSFNLAIIFWFGYLKTDNYKQDIQIKQYMNITPKKDDQEYYGYISFLENNNKRLIKNGNPNLVIEEGYIGIYGYKPLDLNKEPLMLVGHSRSNIFEIIHNIKIDSKIQINKNSEKYVYKVVKKKIIEANDTNVLSNVEGHKLVLITCMDDNSQRLIVIADLV